MSFREKSTWVLLAVTLVVYGWYFVTTLGGVVGADAPAVLDNVRLFGAIVTLVVLTIIAHIVIAILSPKDADQSDERDRFIELRGDQRGAILMGIALFSTMGLAMAGASVFWIAHAALAGLVVSEVVKAVSKLIDYRGGV